MSNITNVLQREGYSIDEARHVAGVGRNKIYDAINSGELPARKTGRRVIILRPDLIRYLNALPAFKAA